MTTMGLDALRGRLRPGLLRWVVGGFCALVGALMLIAPHQFAGPSFAPLRPWLPALGTAFFAAGVATIATSAVGTRGPLAVASSTCAGISLLLLALSFGLSSSWTGVVAYCVFGVATLLSPFLHASGAPGDDGLDLFLLAAGLAGLLNGFVLLVIPGPGMGPVFEALGSPISPYATLFLLGGAGVLTTRLTTRASPLARSVTQIVLGCAFLGWLLGSSIPNRIWTGILFYGGIGSLLLFGLRLAPYARRVDSSSLRFRLALAMASSAAIPLLVVAAIATGWEEQAAAEQHLVLQRALAGGLAADVDGALTQHLVGLELVAEHPVLLSRSTPGPGPLLGAIGDVAPGLLALGTYDNAGRPIVVLGGNDGATQTRLSQVAAEALRRTPPGAMPPPAFLLGGNRPAIVLAAPIRQQNGSLAGLAIGVLDQGWLRQRLQRGIADARLTATVIDEDGQIVVAAGEPIAGGSAPASHPSVQQLRTDAATRGTLRFTTGTGEYLAGYARIPQTDWAVVVEQPTSIALASAWASRELTFVVLLGAFIMASALGVALANRLAAPLAVLARAAQSVATGAGATMLPRSRLYEVRLLARAFAEMQARLAARTAEHERAEDRLQTLVDASAELTSSLEEPAIVGALGTIVVGRLADWCTIDTLDDRGQAHRVLVRHRDRARQALAGAIDDLPPIVGTDLARPARAGEPLLLPAVTPRQLAALADTAEHRRALEWLGVRSAVIVPLRVRDRLIGALTCVYGRGSRRYSPDDLPLIQELALRAALAIDNARLYAAERTARGDAETAVRVREEFLAIAAHELKTPVTSLRGFAELGVRALDARGEIEPALARRTLETIARQTARLSALVANLLEVARGTADRSAITPRQVNLAELARAVVEAARVRADRHQFTLDAPEAVDVQADPLRIEQVLTNLVDNAVKFSPAGSLVDVTVIARHHTAELVVRDRGVGIPDEYQHRVFDRFFQAHVGEQTSGMGLGLYISQEIVQNHGGTIRVETPDDGGTRMIVTLPRAEAPVPTGEPLTPGSQRSA